MIWYILLTILVYFTITIVFPVILYKIGIFGESEMKDGIGVWAGILWPLTLSIFLLSGTYKVTKTLIRKFANVK